MATSSTTITLRVSVRDRRRLDAVARATRRSKSFLAAEALREFLDHQEWQISAIEKGVEDADAGRVVDSQKVEKWVESWGTGKEQARPRCGS